MAAQQAALMTSKRKIVRNDDDPFVDATGEWRESRYGPKQKANDTSHTEIDAMLKILNCNMSMENPVLRFNVKLLFSLENSP